MKETSKTIVAFDERQIESIRDLRKALSENSSGSLGNEEIFLIAVGLGFESGLPVTDFKRSNTGVRVDYIRKSPEVLMLLAAIQLKHSGNLDSITDFDEILNTAERFAASGFKFLIEAYANSPDIRMWLQVEVKQAYEAISGS